MSDEKEVQHKLIFLDIESTGVDSEKHGVIQISGKIKIDGMDKQYFNWMVKPFKTDLVNPEALEVNGLTLNEIKKFPNAADVFMEFQEMLELYVSPYDKNDKFFMVGYNCEKYDSQTLREWFKKNGSNFYGSYFWVPTIDLMSLAAPILMEQRHLMKNFKMYSVAEAFGIDVDHTKLHDAEYDIDITEQIFNKIFGIE